MNTNEMNQQLTEEWNRIDAAINLLSTNVPKAPCERRKLLSAAARKRISEAQQKRRAKEKERA